MRKNKVNIENKKTAKTEKKPFFQRPAGITLIVALVIIIGGGITAFALRDSIIKAFLGPVQYYIYKEGYGIYDLSDDDYSLFGDITIVGDSTSLASWSGSSSSKIGINAVRSSSDNKTQVDIDFLSFLKFSLKQDDKYLSVSVNNIDFETADLSRAKKSTAEKSKSKSKKSSSQTNVNYLDWAYSFSKTCIAASFPEKNIIEATENFNGVKCDVTTFVIDSTVRANVLCRVADNLEKDKTTQSLFKQGYQSIYGSVAGIYGVDAGRFDKNEFANEMREMAKAIKGDKSKILYSVYYDGGKIVNREYKSKQQDITLSTYKEESGNVLSFDFSGACAGRFNVKDSADVTNINLKKNKDKAVSVEELISGLGQLSIGKLLGFESIVPKDEIIEGSVFDDMSSNQEADYLY